MSKVHYFQRYSTRENVVTNNTLHLLKRIYLESPKIFENIVHDICGEKSDEVLEIGPSFEQQTGGAASIPDGRIFQRQFNLLIETKRGDDFDIDQLKQHMEGFKETNNNILIGVCRNDLMSKEVKETLNQFALEKNCRFEIVTFSKIILICRSHVPEFRLDLTEMLDDFEEYCGLEEILEPKEDVLLVFPCSDSYAHNIDYSLYFCKKEKVSKRIFQYVGFYSKKSVRGFGRLSRITTVDIFYNGNRITEVLKDTDLVSELSKTNPKLTFVTGDGQPLSQNEKDRVLDFMYTSLMEWGWVICNDHSFFFLDDVINCDFKKITPYPLQHYRFFNITNIFDSWNKAQSTADIVKQLNLSSWG